MRERDGLLWFWCVWWCACALEHGLTSEYGAVHQYPHVDSTGFRQQTLDEIDREEGIVHAAPFGKLPDASSEFDSDGLEKGNSHGEKLGQMMLGRPTRTKSGGMEAERIFYCHHQDACGTRLYPGPRSVDSLHDGVNCVCRGMKTHAKEMYCFPGRCYDYDRGSAFREPWELDKFGLCEYTEEKQTEVTFCRRKFHERKDPYLRYFTDPPQLNDVERHGDEER